jgi:Protein of unknown function (DUF3102)
MTLRGRITSLADLADEIKTELQNARESARTMMEHVCKLGELLDTAKHAVEHGNWESWLRDNFAITRQTAAGYMRLAKHRDQIKPDVPIREALRMIAKPRPGKRVLHSPAEPSPSQIARDLIKRYGSEKAITIANAILQPRPRRRLKQTNGS